MAEVIDYLTSPELAEYRVLTAKEAMAAGGHPDISLNSGIEAMVQAWDYMYTIQKRYEIDPEDSFDIRVYDGAIIRTPE